jgi:hypothetical protein
MAKRPEGKRPLGRLDADRKLTAKQGNRTGECGLDLSGCEYGPLESCCVHCNGRSDFIKGKEFLDQLRDYYFLSTDYFPQC